MLYVPLLLSPDVGLEISELGFVDSVERAGPFPHQVDAVLIVMNRRRGEDMNP